jgi:peroxiredoxin
MTDGATSLGPQVGEAVPDFTLPSTGGGDVTLSAFRGDKSVLIAFFPLAFTSVCTAELCDFNADFAKFAGKGAVVLPISVDSVPTLKEFKAKLGLGLELLSDFKRTVCRAYGTLMEDKFYSRRAYFLIDRSGRLAWKHVEAENKQRRKDDELLQQLELLV